MARPTPPNLRAPVVGAVAPDDGMQGLMGTAIGDANGQAAVDYTGSHRGQHSVPGAAVDAAVAAYRVLSCSNAPTRDSLVS